METNWAAEHLQTIRTLMERSALYRRALAPVFTFVGVAGIAAGIIGWILKLTSVGAFTIYWMAVCLIVIAGALLLVRQQALKSAEKFWSPPTRRIAQAIVPALLVGLVQGLIMIRISGNGDGDGQAILFLLIIPWTILYGLALQAASFFVSRGMRFFGWGFIFAGLLGYVLLAWNRVDVRNIPPHVAMGVLFGVSHLAGGIYLYFTEQRKNEA